jgi:putative transposase
VTTANGKLEVTMENELAARQLAIQLRLAGESIDNICQQLNRSRSWFNKWWGRYMAEGAEGLYDLSRAPRTIVDQTPPHVERMIVSIRRRLEAHATPETRYQRIGAATIRAELKALGVSPVPSLRTIDRVLHRRGMTSPRVRTAPPLRRSEYPAPTADDSNQLHQVDLVGPIYLKGKRQRWYIYICKDVFDGGVYLKLAPSRKMDEVLAFLTEAWQHLGLPAQVQFDNARELAGWGRSARYLSRVIRLCLRLRVTPIFIPPGRPQHNGSVENYNGWFQPVLFQRIFKRPTDLRRELAHLMTTTNERHVQPRLGLPYGGAVSTRQTLAQATRQVHTQPRSTTHFGRAGYLYPMGVQARNRFALESVIQNRPTLQIHLCPSRARHTPTAPHHLRRRANCQALAI